MEVLETRRKVVVFCVIAMALMMRSMDTVIVATALQEISVSLKTDLNWVGWTMTAYAFGLMVALPATGQLTDKFGRRNVFLGSIALFVLTSIACGISTDIATLICFRFLQGVGGAGMTPAATGIVVDHFGSGRDRAIGLFGSIFPIGTTIGPVVGGIIVQHVSWRFIFFVNVPLGLLVLLLAAAYIPSGGTVAPAGKTPFDWRGSALLAASVFGFMLFTATIAEHRSNTTMLVLLLSGITTFFCGWGFFKYISSHRNPIIEGALIYGAGFRSVNFVNFLYSGVAAGMLALVPLYSRQRFFFDAIDAAYLLAAAGAATVLASIFGAIVIRAAGYRRLMFCGVACIIAAIFGLGMSGVANIGTNVMLGAFCVLFGIGIGVFAPASRNAALYIRPLKSPHLTALRTMCRESGQLVAISITTAVLAGSDVSHVSFQHVYLVCGLVMLALIPSIHFVPEHKGAW